MTDAAEAMKASLLVGRDTELTHLGAVLAEAAKGAGSVVLVSGEAGIGKTRLCAEFSGMCRDRGGRVLAGRAVPEEASVPYAAVADALRAARRSEPPVWEAAQARAGILAAIIPELAAQSSAAAQPVDRLVLFEALLDAVEEASGDAVTLWILDDLHWADGYTWEFARYAARRVADLGMILALTYRDEEIGQAHPWWPALVRLQREPVVARLPLPRLTPSHSEQLVRALDPALPAAAVADIVRRGAGTPLLVEELVALSAAAGGTGTPSAVPDSVHATVRELVSRLSPPQRSLLEVGAVIGQDVRGALLAALVPDDDPAPLVSAGLLVAEGTGFRFRHPLFQEAVYAYISPERRRALHEETATALAKTDDQAAELIAAHLERAGRPEAALLALDNAAAEASQAGQLGRAATLQVCALQLAQRQPPLAAQRDELARKAIWRLFATGRWTELGPLLRGRWTRRHQLPAAERAQLAAVYCKYLFWTGTIDQTLEAAAAELIVLEELGARHRCGSLMLEAGLVAFYAGDQQQAKAFVRDALAVARQAGDTEGEMVATFADIYLAYGERGDPAAAISRLRASIAAAHARGFAAAAGTGRLMLTMLAGTSYAAEGGEVPDHADVRSRVAAMYEATFRLLEGDPADSEAVFGQIRQGYELRLPAMMAWVEAREAWLYLHQGNLGAARGLLLGANGATEAARRGLIGAERAAAQGWLAWEEDRLGEASSLLAAACSADLLGLYNATAPGLPFLALRVDALLRLGHADEAAAAIAAAESLDLSFARFAAAALAAARFRQAPTRAAADEAAAAAAAAPWPWLRALVGCWRGEFLADGAAAEDARERFAVLAASLGVRRAEGVLRRLRAGAAAEERGDGLLSPREVQVAELIAQGLTNPAIARRLYLTRPTVASHVAHILAKLGFSSRTQIAAWVAQRDSPPAALAEGDPAHPAE
jgi:DNA-binding CsgD family transcriptional regulator